MNFKVGDKVRCINADWGLKNNTIYTIKSYQDKAYGELEVIVEELQHQGSFFETRFILDHSEFNDKLEDLLK